MDDASEPSLLTVKKQILLRPRRELAEKATFNTAALNGDGIVHLFPRIENNDGDSDIGYAEGHFEGDEIIIDFWDTKPLLNKNGYKSYEDARVFVFNGKRYMAFTIHDGMNAMVGLAEAVDSELRNWNQIGIISPKVKMSEAIKSVRKRPGLEYYASLWEADWREHKGCSPDALLDNKNAFFLPRPINGQSFMPTRFLPDMHIVPFTEISDLQINDFWEDKIPRLDEYVVLRAGTEPWMNYRVGWGAPPIETDEGLLALFHGVQDLTPGRKKYKKLKYSMGALFLDPENPRRVLRITKRPLYSKGLISFPTGAFPRGENVHITYGAGKDRYTAHITMSHKSILERCEPIYA